MPLRRLAWQLEGDDIDLIVASSLIDVAGERTTSGRWTACPCCTWSTRASPVPAGWSRPRSTGSGALLVALFAPLFLAVALAIRLDSPGPVLFRQVRVGRRRQEFRMVQVPIDVPSTPRPAWRRCDSGTSATAYSSRCATTRGSPGSGVRCGGSHSTSCRSCSTWCVGQMSLVGPRPPLPERGRGVPGGPARRLAVKPGMTGLWQVSGRSDLPWEEAVRLDLRYVENWTLSLDLVILLRTLTAVYAARGRTDLDPRRRVRPVGGRRRGALLLSVRAEVGFSDQARFRKPATCGRTSSSGPMAGWRPEDAVLSEESAGSRSSDESAARLRRPLGCG